MSFTKKRPQAHIIGDKAINIIRNMLPEEWVIREFHQDYGIDLMIEIFNAENSSMLETLGEFLYIQSKGIELISNNFGKFKINGHIIDVIKYKLDTSFLNTVERVGSAVPILLFLVDIKNNKIYYICLNDYIEKILDTKYKKNKTKIINIPLANIIDNNTNMSIIEWYSFRAKLFSFFNFINSLELDIPYHDYNEFYNYYKNKLLYIFNLDIWNRKRLWPILNIIYEEIEYFLINDIPLQAKGIIDKRIEDGEDIDMINQESTYLSILVSFRQAIISISLINIFKQMQNLSGMYETYCKNWFIPTATYIYEMEN